MASAHQPQQFHPSYHPQQYVVVWECQQASPPVANGSSHSSHSHQKHDKYIQASSTLPGKWRPYTPAVSQVLEKAYRSRLTQVLLGDADPALSKFRVSLTSMVQICEFSEEASPVRRKLYPRGSPAGRGIRWDWLGDRPSEWIDFDMSGQIAIETAFSSGLKTLDLSRKCPHLPYIINFCNMTQVRRDTGFVRSIRRQTQQATYPAALKNELPEIQASTSKTDPEKSTKHNWLAGIINHVVKSPSKHQGDTKHVSSKQVLKGPGANSCPAGVNLASKIRTADGPPGRSRKDARPNKNCSNPLRLERRARSSSLDTIFTTLS